LLPEPPLLLLLFDPPAVLPPLTLPWTTPTLPPPPVLIDALELELPVDALDPPAEVFWLAFCPASAGEPTTRIPKVITAINRKRMVASKRAWIASRSSRYAFRARLLQASTPASTSR
jgi:hypothetical protein